MHFCLSWNFYNWLLFPNFSGRSERAVYSLNATGAKKQRSREYLFLLRFLYPVSKCQYCDVFSDIAPSKSLQGSHSDWKTWKKWEGIFQSTKKSGNFEQTGKVRENHTKYLKTQETWDKYYLRFLVIFKWTLYYLLKWIKFSVKKTKHLKNTSKLEKNTGKVREILSVRKSGNPVPRFLNEPSQSLQKWVPTPVNLIWCKIMLTLQNSHWGIV